MADLSVEYLGLKMKNPLIVASSGLTRNARLVKRCSDAGAGAVVMKSIFEEDIRRRDNTFDDALFDHTEAADYYNAEVGLVYGAQQYCDQIKKTKDSVDIPVIASVNCANPKWWVDYASQLEAAGADALEINLSVPSVEIELSSRESEDTFCEIVSAVRGEVELPVAVKISGQITAPQHLASRLVHSGADALVCFNRTSGLDVDINTRRSFTSKGDQGLTTPHHIYYPLRWIAILSELMPDVQLSASGGVHDGEAMIKYILAGATTVQVASLFYRQGIEQAGKLLETLDSYLESQGADSVGAIRGAVSSTMPIGTRQQQRAEYMELSRGHYVEVDSTDGGGLVFETHPEKEEEKD